VSPEQPEFETVAQAENPHQPLPDLTQGIPSTLGAELEAARKGRKTTSLNLTEDPSQHDYEDEGAGGGRSSDAYESSLDRRRARVANVMYGIILGGLLGGTVYMGRNWDSEEEARAHKNAPSGWGVGLFYDRIKARMNSFTSYYRDPAFEKLLPEEDASLRQPYTLVLSLEDLLVHSEWTREHGWRVAKRPGVDYFLRYLNQYYELVLFTSVPSMMADQVIRKLDPFRIIRWPLFREATKYKDGEYVKVSFAHDIEVESRC
jgi:import inner membrane translocase subunit TIM50